MFTIFSLLLLFNGNFAKAQNEQYSSHAIIECKVLTKAIVSDQCNINSSTILGRKQKLNLNGVGTGQSTNQPRLHNLRLLQVCGDQSCQEKAQSILFTQSNFDQNMEGSLDINDLKLSYYDQLTGQTVERSALSRRDILPSHNGQINKLAFLRAQIDIFNEGTAFTPLKTDAANIRNALSLTTSMTAAELEQKINQNQLRVVDERSYHLSLRRLNESFHALQNYLLKSRPDLAQFCTDAWLITLNKKIITLPENWESSDKPIYDEYRSNNPKNKDCLAFLSLNQSKQAAQVLINPPARRTNKEMAMAIQILSNPTQIGTCSTSYRRPNDPSTFRFDPVLYQACFERIMETEDNYVAELLAKKKSNPCQIGWSNPFANQNAEMILARVSSVPASFVCPTSLQAFSNSSSANYKKRLLYNLDNNQSNNNSLQVYYAQSNEGHPLKLYSTPCLEQNYDVINLVGRTPSVESRLQQLGQCLTSAPVAINQDMHRGLSHPTELSNGNPSSSGGIRN